MAAVCLVMLSCRLFCSEALTFIPKVLELPLPADMPAENPEVEPVPLDSESVQLLLWVKSSLTPRAEPTAAWAATAILLVLAAR